MELTYPGAISPRPPAFRLQFPDGWQERPHATAVGFAVDTRSPAGFTVNVVVLVTRVLAQLSLEALVDELRAGPTVRAMAPVEQGRRRDVIDGQEAVLSAYTLTAPALPFPLFQAQMAILLPGPVSHLVHGYATCPAAVAESYAKTFRAIFASLRFARSDVQAGVAT